MIEKARMTTITLSNVPELTTSVSAPRIAAISHPMGRTISEPGDQATQIAVLRSVLQSVETIDKPGEIIHLPFSWNEPKDRKRPEKLEAPPIAKLLMRSPWQLPRLFSRNLP